MFRHSLFVLTVAGACLSVGPALASGACFGFQDGPSISFGFHLGEPYTEAEQNEFDLMTLRRLGVDAVSVVRWSGCIKADVRNVGRPGIHTEFYRPDTFERVD